MYRWHYGLTTHDIKMLAWAMFKLYNVILKILWFTNNQWKKSLYLGCNEVKQLNQAPQVVIKVYPSRTNGVFSHQCLCEQLCPVLCGELERFRLFATALTECEVELGALALSHRGDATDVPVWPLQGTTESETERPTCHVSTSHIP